MVDILVEWEQKPSYPFPYNTPILQTGGEWEDVTGSEDVQPGDLGVLSAESGSMEVLNVRNKLPNEDRNKPLSELKVKLKKPKKSRV